MSALVSHSAASSQLLARLIATPELLPALAALPPVSFAALVRHIGVEDAGEILALASTEQLVTAFDEDLFQNSAPGQRETFDSARFAVWLEVLLEAGESAAAARFVELSEDFAVFALSCAVLVLEEDALRARMEEGGDDAVAADKALESALCEEIDGYLLIARQPEGFDAVLSLILALDRDHRPFLERILDRCAELSHALLKDLDELATHLSLTDSLAEDVEAEREARRSALGYVEPRAARSFLTLAQKPLETDVASVEQDPITRAYFRELAPRRQMTAKMPPTNTGNGNVVALLGAVTKLCEAEPVFPSTAGSADQMPIIAALQLLEASAADIFARRVDELWYLANVLLAGAKTSSGQGRLRPAEAIEAVLATVSLGALLVVPNSQPSSSALVNLLRDCSADRLFRRASSALGPRGFLRSRTELRAFLESKGRLAVL